MVRQTYALSIILLQFAFHVEWSWHSSEIHNQLYRGWSIFTRDVYWEWYF
jgi:hypothetical protein